MKQWQLAGLAVVALGAVPAGSLARGGKGASYTFRAPPVNSMGVTSLADLRGKPVLIDFWGTR